jgi:hypothetical protein
MPYGGNDWLALTQEPTLEPELPICTVRRRPTRPCPAEAALEVASASQMTR